jgi:large subunit ribosomal protein L13
MTTTFPSEPTVQRGWILVDAKGQVLGRLASRIALILRGKDKPSFTPFIDTGDFVIVTNAAQIKVTGNKAEQKIYERYSGYPGGRKVRTMAQVLESHPDRVIRQAVKGMMPDGPLARRQLRKLKIYNGAAHPHASQQPSPRNPTGATT